MSKRGWKQQSVVATIQNPASTAATRDNRYNIDGTQKNEPATVYYRSDGHYVVCNDLTGDIVQVSDTNDPNWIDPFGNIIGSP
ncbi:MAG: hypothetical protein EBE86_014270 [Hormoscilla sp. GUM202]|nr:hypothetical protein [Hormoscilla sp. GUM202]